MPYVAIVPYADRTYADAYFAERLDTATWDATANATKDKALKQATSMIDQLPLVGEKCTSAQARAFPRNLDTGCADGSGAVPEEVTQACCEVARALLEGLTLEALALQANVKSENVGDASVSYGSARGQLGVYDDNYGLPSTAAAQLLAPWLADADRIDLVRV
jgi:hypothetical protein